MSLSGKTGVLRQAMNAANALGTMIGYAQRYLEEYRE